MGSIQKFTVNQTLQPAGHRVFHDEMKRHFAVGLAVQSPQARPFNTQVSGYSGRNLRFAALRFSPHTTSSPHGDARGSRMLVTLQREGVTLVQQGGRESRIGAGDMFIVDPSRPFFIETGAILTHSIFIDAAQLRAALPEAEDLTARAVRTADGAGAVFRTFADGLFATADALEEPAADRIADAVPHLVAAALTPLLKDQRPTPSKLRLLHRQRVARFIADNLRNHRLDAAQIAAGINLSVRTLYALFDDGEAPPMQQVCLLRLQRCHAELQAAGSGNRTIGEIADYWGFRDPAHFSRAFRRRYAVSPREFRRSAQAPALEPAC